MHYMRVAVLALILVHIPSLAAPPGGGVVVPNSDGIDEDCSGCPTGKYIKTTTSKTQLKLFIELSDIGIFFL